MSRSIEKRIISFFLITLLSGLSLLAVGCGGKAPVQQRYPQGNAYGYYTNPNNPNHHTTYTNSYNYYHNLNNNSEELNPRSNGNNENNGNNWNNGNNGTSKRYNKHSVMV